MIVEEEDYNLIDRARSLDMLDGKETDVLELYSNLEYDVTEELVDEILTVDEFMLPEHEMTQMYFYVNPRERNNRSIGKALRKKLESIGSEYALIAMSYHLRNKEKKQEKDGLILKRVSVPLYMATIIRGTSLINCTTEVEIKECVLDELRDIFK